MSSSSFPIPPKSIDLGSLFLPVDSSNETPEEAVCRRIKEGTIDVFDFFPLSARSSELETGFQHCAILINPYTVVPHHGVSPLQIASIKGREDLVNLFIDVLGKKLAVNCGVAVNTQCHRKYSSRTALSFACQQGHIGIAKKLIDSGANLQISDIKGATPLHYASSHNQTQIIDLLVNSIASKEIRINYLNRKVHGDGYTALFFAARSGTPEMVIKLIAAGALVNTYSTTGFTPLIAAANAGNIQTVYHLILNGADHLQSFDSLDFFDYLKHRGKDSEFIDMMIREISENRKFLYEKPVLAPLANIETLITLSQLNIPEPDSKRLNAFFRSTLSHPNFYKALVKHTEHIELFIFNHTILIGASESIPSNIPEIARVAKLVGSLLSVMPKYFEEAPLLLINGKLVDLKTRLDQAQLQLNELIENPF